MKDLGITDLNSNCNCGHGHAAQDHSSAPAANSAAVQTDYLVEGMTCGHCVQSVTEELSELEGVESVAVDLKPGAPSRVTVASRRPIDLETVRAAVTEAGYSLADSGS